MRNFCVIGSGISGATIANLLSKKHSVDLYDKARGLGGRSSFKRLDEKRGFDHGAQYFSPKSVEFKKFTKMLIEKNINLNSTCEHHFLPITGKAHVSYISSGKVIGLSKLNRIVQYYSHRPQVQERLTTQIYNELKEVLGTDSVMVVVEAKHLCISARGIKDFSSSTVTEMYGGDFNIYNKRDEFYKLLNSVVI